MAKRLILTRHTKSSWDDPTMADHDRPLNDRGHTAAADLGDWLASRGLTPDQVFCSDALRTRQTWEGIAKTLNTAPEATLKPALYNAGPDVIMAVLRHATGDTVQLIAHNPGIAECAERLLATPPADPAFGRYPTGATTVISFEIESWADLAPAQGALRDFVVPRELAS